ncbi:MAG: hypothetical protein ABMA64_37010 [Myxococcota bacterium]
MNEPAHDQVRSEVRGLLSRSEAFQRLAPPERAKLANALVRVVSFLADPNAANPDLGERRAPTEALAAALAATGADKVADRLAKKPEFAGKDFQAGAMKAGTRAFRDLVDAVDFPKFVSGLIEGVFQSIVTSSIRQMDAYAKLLEGVATTVDQFANDHITENAARDWLTDKFPRQLQVQTAGGKPKLAARSDDLEPVRTHFKLESSLDLDDEGSEAELVRAARLELARMRQQQLATMVLLGIHRIVVTDGMINARVLFDVTASDEASRKNRASLYDDKTEKSGTGGGWFSDDFTENTHKTVVTSSQDDTSESKAKMKATLAGEVRVAFKSETVPLDKLASQIQIAAVNDRAAPNVGVVPAADAPGRAP